MPRDQRSVDAPINPGTERAPEGRRPGGAGCWAAPQGGPANGAKAARERGLEDDHQRASRQGRSSRPQLDEGQEQGQDGEQPRVGFECGERRSREARRPQAPGSHPLWRNQKPSRRPRWTERRPGATTSTSCQLLDSGPGPALGDGVERPARAVIRGGVPQGGRDALAAQPRPLPRRRTRAAARAAERPRPGRSRAVLDLGPQPGRSPAASKSDPAFRGSESASYGCPVC